MIKATGPQIFSNLSRLHPASLTAAGIHDLHQKINTEVAATLTGLGGPLIRPIRAEVLSARDYRSSFAATQTATGAAQPEAKITDAFVFASMENGIMSSDVCYNFEALTKREAEGKPSGQVAVHECLTTVYHSWLEKYFVSLGIETFSYDNLRPEYAPSFQAMFENISRIAEGLACYCSDSPIQSKNMMILETAVTNHRQALLDKGMWGDAECIMRDQHSFGTLALLKMDRAFGFDAVIQILNDPLAVLGGQAGDQLFDPGQLFSGLWRLYDQANKRLGEPSMPYELWTAVLFSGRPVTGFKPISYPQFVF
jgi:hypothetical protein